ncbi:hypothetical protein QBK99_23610 [Corticibacterium sp. UT-5YL-CI-8]|nr:hypothetical protein [Tianweitania sp. UT-5YL-CI-8]
MSGFIEPGEIVGDLPFEAGSLFGDLSAPMIVLLLATARNFAPSSAINWPGKALHPGPA